MKQNREVIRNSLVYALQLSYRNLINKHIRLLENSCIDRNGDLRLYDGDCIKEIKELNEAKKALVEFDKQTAYEG